MGMLLFISLEKYLEFGLLGCMISVYLRMTNFSKVAVPFFIFTNNEQLLYILASI